MKIFDNVIISIIMFLTLLLSTFAAGGGGGGSSGSGLGFSTARDSVLISINKDYSQKFSLRNGTKYDLKVNVDGNVSVTFGYFSMSLNKGDNFMDLNNNSLADINFNLIKVDGRSASIRIIDAKELVNIMKKNVTVEKPKQEKEVVNKDNNSKGDFKCSDLTTLKERVSCRLELEEDEQEQELELYYLPEECRNLSGSLRGLCIARYKSVQTCWKFLGNERTSCAKREIKLGIILEEEKKCNNLTEQEKSVCVRELKNKVYSLIKWHFYDLEERAEDFMQRGLIDKETVVGFIEKTENNKIRFNQAISKEERKSIILDVRNYWKELVKTVKTNLGA